MFFFPTLVTEKVTTYIFLLQEEDDWKEFEQKEEIDYSGLRVQSMQIRYYFFFFFFFSIILTMSKKDGFFLQSCFHGVQLKRDLICS